jgi:hypothetical protein
MGGLALSRLGHVLDTLLVERIGDAHLPQDVLAEHLDRIREEDRRVWESAPRRSRFHRLLEPATP